MARIAIQYADLLILNTDNPRYEDVNKIIDETETGINKFDETMTISYRLKQLKQVYVCKG